jgi:hypothetical protein
LSHSVAVAVAAVVAVVAAAAAAKMELVMVGVAEMEADPTVGCYPYLYCLSHNFIYCTHNEVSYTCYIVKNI